GLTNAQLQAHLIATIGVFIREAGLINWKVGKITPGPELYFGGNCLPFPQTCYVIFSRGNQRVVYPAKNVFPWSESVLLTALGNAAKQPHRKENHRA
ncbi:MAG: hypothetical protein JXR76_17060, partial [Deltaproteobacteria bacterium]|nr:hypothetical protein [Deltaproteobacteria bacterium]